MSDPRDIVADALCLWPDRNHCGFRDKHLPDADRVIEALCAAGLLVQPGGEARTWSLPAEPGYEVTALRCDCHARIWHHDGTMWRSPGWPFEHFRWPGLLANHPKLTDATQEAPHA